MSGRAGSALAGRNLNRAATHSTLRASCELAVVCVAALIFYRLLYAQMPYHDVMRFRNQVESGQFVWDIGHIFLQPATLLWHRYLGFGESAIDSQRHINTFATALAVAIFDALLLRQRLGNWQRWIATALLAGSGSVITLAPTGHMKLLAFPLVNAALYLGVAWEQQHARRGRAAASLWIGCGALLGIGASFLASVLATGPFATLAVLIVSRRDGDSWPLALRRAICFGAIALGVFLLLACFGFLIFSGQPVSIAGLQASVEAKADLKSPGYAWLPTLARLGFATVNNITAAPVLSALGRALLSGQLQQGGPHGSMLLAQAVPWLISLVILALIYLRSAIAAARGAACAIPLAFLCGAQAWTIYYGLDDPEHWFQLTAPSILLFLLVVAPSVPRWVLPAWTATALATNLAFVAVPVALYPFDRYQAELRTQFTPNDLVIEFAAFPGRPWGGVFDFPGVPVLQLDVLLRDKPEPGAYFAAMQQQIDAALARGGRVVVLDVLSPEAWEAPWPAMYRAGMTKPRLFGFFANHYQVRPLPPIAEVKAWQVLPRDTQHGG